MTTTLRNRYEITQGLSSGAFGQTYKARDLDFPNQPSCVVKALKPDAHIPLAIAKDFFEKEAAILYKLKHDQIPGLYAYFEDEDIENPKEKCFYLAQDFVDGHTLDREIQPNQRLDEQKVIGLLVDILEVLDYVHGQNVIHRDLKPANIMRRNDGKIVLIDFGAVKQIKGLTVNNGQTESTIAIGTPGYMPNEQSNRRPKLSSDVYAVGMIGIQALTGQYPHLLPEDNNGEVIWRNLASQVSPKFAQILDNMVKDHFSKRYANAGLALEALLPLDQRPKVRQTSGTNRINTVISSPVPPLWKRREVIFAGLGLTGVGVAFLAKELLQPSPTKPFQFTTVRLNAVGEIVERKNLSAELLTEDLGNGIVLEMVKIPGGTFMMGSPDTEVDRSNDEGPQHRVTVPDFYMGKYVVTQAQWRQVAQLPKINLDLSANPSYADKDRFTGDQRPVQSISWLEAVEFCARLSKKTGKLYRLPSEAEWEYGCRAGTGKNQNSDPFYFGPTITTDVANYDGNSTYANGPKGVYRNGTTDVGGFPPNIFGLYDMHGNVWEWCADIWHDNYNGAPTDGRIWLNGETYSSAINEYTNITYTKYKRVLRGGSWDAYPRYCRSAYRSRFDADVRYNGIGFRLCLSVS